MLHLVQEGPAEVGPADLGQAQTSLLSQAANSLT
jgi:hypothetical protein